MTGAWQTKRFADVGRRPAVDRVAADQQRHPVALAPRQDEMGAESPAFDGGERIGVRAGAGDRHLLDARQIEVDRLQRVPEGVRMAADDRCQDPQDAQRVALVGGIARQRRQAQQPEGRGRAAGRDRRILQVLAAGDQPESWSTAVEKNPPRSSSAKRSIMAPAIATASAYHRGSNVASYSVSSASSR